MKGKTNNLLIVAVIVIIVIAGFEAISPANHLIAFAGFTPQTSVPDFFKLAIIDPNQKSAGAITCYFQHELKATTDDGKVLLASFNQEGSFDPNLIIGNLLDQYGRTLIKVDGILLLKCDPLPSSLSTISVMTADGGNSRMILYGFDSQGKQLQLLDTGYVNVQPNQVVNGKTITVGSWSITNSQITDMLGYNGLAYKSQLQGFMTSKIDFKYSFSKTAQFQYTSTTSAPVLFTVTVAAPSNPIVQNLPFLYTQAAITLTDPANGKVNPNINAVQRGYGSIHGYDPTVNGTPKLEVYYTDQNANIQQQTTPVYSFTLTQYTKDSNGNGIFQFSFPVRTLQLGTYTIKFSSDHTNVASQSLVVSTASASTASTSGSKSTSGGGSSTSGGGTNSPCGSIDNPCGSGTGNAGGTGSGGGAGGGSSATNIFSDFSSCLSSGDTSCLANSEFILIYVLGLVIIVAFVGLATRSSGQ